jgi:hypothetical protein
LAAAHAADLHTCKLSADRRLVAVLVSNPYPQETQCTVNCHVTFPGEGINIISITCAKSVPGGVKDFELCSRTRDNNGVFVKLADAGNSECIKPLAEQKIDKDEEGDDRLGEQIRKQGEEMLRMLKRDGSPQCSMGSGHQRSESGCSATHVFFRRKIDAAWRAPGHRSSRDPRFLRR